MSSVNIATQAKAANIGASLLKLTHQNGTPTFQKAIPLDLKADRVVLFIHGFTADAGYMLPVMTVFESAGFNTLAFNYPCYDGIDTAARSLRDLLESFDQLTDGALSQSRIALIGHSMGGLVARAFVGLEGGHTYVRKLITLGTPNNGTLGDSKLLEWFVAAYESISGMVHGGFSKSGKSARQLMKKDSPHAYLDQIQASSVPPGSVEFHSVSGGRPYLTVGTNPLFTRVINFAIQKYLAGCENDGLVPESSSDLSGASFGSCAAGCQHHRDYSDYKKINHTHLCESHILNLKLLKLVQ